VAQTTGQTTGSGNRECVGAASTPCGEAPPCIACSKFTSFAVLRPVSMASETARQQGGKGTAFHTEISPPLSAPPHHPHQPHQRTSQPGSDHHRRRRPVPRMEDPAPARTAALTIAAAARRRLTAALL